MRSIRCGTLFDGTGADPIPDAVVVVDDGRITAVGPADATRGRRPAPQSLDLERPVRHAGPHRRPQPRLDRARARRPDRPALPGAGAAGPAATRESPPGPRRRHDDDADHGRGALPRHRRARRHRGRRRSPGRACSWPPAASPPTTATAERSSASTAWTRSAAASRENFRRGADHVKIFVTGGVSSPGAMSTSSVYTREEIRAAVEEAERAGTLRRRPRPRRGRAAAGGARRAWRTIEHGALADGRGHRADDRAPGLAHLHLLDLPAPDAASSRATAQRPAIMEKMRWARRVVDESFPRHLASGVRFACGTDSHARSHAVRAADARAPRRVDARRAAGRHRVGRRGVSHRRRRRDARARQAGRPDRASTAIRCGTSRPWIEWAWS